MFNRRMSAQAFAKVYPALFVATEEIGRAHV